MIFSYLISRLHEVFSSDRANSVIQTGRKISAIAALNLVLFAIPTAGALASTDSAQAQAPTTLKELKAELSALRKENAKLKKENEEAKKKLGDSTPSTGSTQPQASTPSACPTPAQTSQPADEKAKTLDSLTLPIQLLGLQYNGVYQTALPFKRPYSGPNSFGNKDTDYTQTGGLYLGIPLTPCLQFYVDTEIFKGDGLSNGTGLGGFVNGDVVRAGSSNLPKVPYVARAYLRYIIPLGAETEKVERGMDQLPGVQPVSRWDFKVGRMALSDDFDQNRYANNNRTQFLNYDFLFNPSWDYAADTRGYTFEALAALYQPTWRLAFGIGMEPNTQNGAAYDWPNNGSEMIRELGYNLEYDIKPNSCGTVLRFLAYYNTGRMGNFEDAILLAEQTNTVPNILQVEQLGGYQYGVAFNFEQPLANDGQTGIFGRAGWRNPQTEDWAYVECNWAASLGAQIAGANWNRPTDYVGLAYGVNGLSNSHAQYLAMGGLGMLLGDGALSYGYEQAVEAYYSFELYRCNLFGYDAVATITPDYQFLINPGYNTARGPANVFGVRMRLVY